MRLNKSLLYSWREPAPLLKRMSLNQKTLLGWTLPEAAEACARQGFSWFGPRIDAIRGLGQAKTARLFQDCGLEASSVCYSGKFVSPSPEQRKKRIEDCRRAIEDTAAIDGKVLVIIPGTDPQCSPADCRAMIEDGLSQTLPLAEQAGVVLGIEPLHPMYAADLSIVVTLKEALDMVDRFDSPCLGVVADVFHLWWDPELPSQLERAGAKLCGYHVNDWVPLKFGPNSSRGMMGDGMIPLRDIRAQVERAGYFGPIEIEIFNEDLWRQPCAEALRLCRERYARFA